MLIIKENKKFIYVALIFIFLFQILDIALGTFKEKTDYYDNCETTFHEELTGYSKNSSTNNLIVKFETFPINPEIENIRCLNKIIAKSYDQNTSKTIYQVGYSSNVYYLQFLLFILFVILNFRFFKFTYIEILLILDLFLYLQFNGLPVYISITQILKLNIFLITLGIFIFNFRNILEEKKYDESVKKLNESYIFLFLLNICIFIFFEHMKNFFYEGYYLHFSAWTVNYEGGINRRGLIGEMITTLYSGKNIKLIIVFLISGIHSWLTFNIYSIFKLVKQNYLSVLIFLSPFYVLFVINDFRGGNMKEIMGFLSLSLLILFNLKKNRFYLVLSLIVYFVAVFSHNLNVFIMPAILFYVFYVSNLDQKIFVGISYFSITVANILIYFSQIMQNSFFNINEWCDKLIPKYNLYESCFELRTGNLLDLRVNGGVFETISYTITNFNFMTFLNYFIVFLIINLYVFRTDYFKNKLKGILVLYISFLPLFILALDWGRWIHILFFTIFTIYLSDENKIIDLKNYKTSFLIFIIPTFFVYNPHCCATFSLKNIISYNLDSFHILDFFMKLYQF